MNTYQTLNKCSLIYPQSVIIDLFDLSGSSIALYFRELIDVLAQLKFYMVCLYIFIIYYDIENA